MELRHRQHLSPNTLTFVPGTWAHGPFEIIVRRRLAAIFGSPELSDKNKWFDPDYKFAAGIDAKNFNIYVLRWSERNSMADRRTAAALLASHLLERSKEAEAGQHFVVAHSHGGNIAAMAFARTELAPHLCRVHFASMSSPFIWVYKRGLKKGVEISARPMLALLVLLGCLFVLTAVFYPLDVVPQDFARGPTLLPEWAWVYLLVGGAGLVGVVALFVSILALRGLWRFWTKVPVFLDEAEKATSPAFLARLGSLLIIQPAADEAWLTLSQPAFALWLNRIAGWLVAQGTGLTRLSIRVLAAVAVPVMMAIGLRSFAMGTALESVVRISAAGGLLLMAALFLLACVQGVLFAIVGVLGAAVLCSLGFGIFEGIALIFGAETHIEQYPPGGPWPVFCSTERVTGLRHGIYESVEVQSVLSAWLRTGRR